MTRKNRQERRERPVRDRFIASVLAGGIVAGLVTWWADSDFHRSLVASVARSAARGDHQTVGGLLFSGFIAVTVVVAIVLFIVATVRARRRQARLDAQLQARAARVPRRRRAAAGR